jgi:polar amino acid transport system substrate-binding protein
MRSIAAAAAALLCIGVAGCQFPRDPEGTLNRVEGGTLRVGVVHSPPFVDLSGGQPQGVEPALIRAFARRLDARIEWVEGSESELIEAMRGYQVDVIIGGLTRTSEWRRQVALTRPYVDTEVQFAVPRGQELPDDLHGRRIWVERHSEEAALLRNEEEEAEPVYVEDAQQVRGPALLHTYDIDALGYERTNRIVRDNEHAMAVPMGENAFLVELDRFLLERGEEAEELLKREAAK